MSKVYVASSWRNPRQQEIVRSLRQAGHEVYDFRNPPNGTGFSWKQISARPPSDWSTQFYRDDVLTHPRAIEAFRSDMGALEEADAVVLVLPCGRSAHLEAGWAAGANKTTLVLLADKIDEPELMPLMCSAVCIDIDEVIEHLRKVVGK